MVDYNKARDCEHGRQIGKCVDCEYQDLLGELSDIRAERDALRAELEEKNTELNKWKYVPGVMHCAKCNFQLIKSNLNIHSGTVTAGDSNPEPCPNDCGPLWRVSWEKYANDHYEGGVEAFEKLRAAELEIESVLQQWNEIVLASGSKTHGGAIGHVSAMRAENEALKAELKAAESRLHEVAVACANAEFEIKAARNQEPVAYMYKGEAYFDGDAWHDTNEVTTSKQLADFNGKSIPLYASPVPAQPSVISGGIPDVTEEELQPLTNLCQLTLVPAPEQQPNEVPIPQNAGQADGMALIGTALLREYAPERQPADVTPEYPMQPMFLDDGLPRFEKNPIVDWLSDKIGLNEISRWWQENDVSQKYIEQFYQLNGYSIRGYEELDAVSDENFKRASNIAEKLTGDKNQ